MKEAEYATDKFEIVHRGLSVLLVVGVVVWAVMNGYWSVGRTIMGFCLPIGFIWFPEAVAATSGELFSPRVIRWAGWGLLLVVAFLPGLLGMIFG